MISCLLVAKQNNEFLLKNHQFHLIDFILFLEANVISSHDSRCGRGHEHGQRHSHGCGKHNSKYYGGHQRKNTTYHQKWNNSEAKSSKNGKDIQGKQTHE